MRIGTRIIKVTAWLSAATLVALIVSCMITLKSQLALNRTEHSLLAIRSGAISLKWSSSGRVELSPGALYLDLGPPLGYPPLKWWFESDLSLSFVYVLVPLWFPAALCLAIGVPAFVTLRRRARAIKNGACPKCGYMLTGLAPAAPCPECGRARA